MKGQAAVPAEGRSRRRGKAFWVTVSGAVLLFIAVLLAGGSVSAARESSDFDAARPCVLPAAWVSDCVQQVPGTVSGVVNTSGKGARHELEVATAEGERWVSFPGGNTIVSSILDDAPVTLTVWRAHIVAVAGLGTEVATSATPARHLHNILGGTLFVFGLALFMLPAVGFARIEDRGRRPSAKVTFASFTTLLSGFPMVAAAFASLGGVSPGADCVATAAFLVPVLAFAAWLANRSLAGQRQRVKADSRLARSRGGTATKRSARPGGRTPAPVEPSKLAPRPRAGRRLPRVRMADLWSYAFLFLGIGTAATFIMMVAECVPGRAHDHAPFCASGVVASSCRADIPLQVVGTRSNDANLTVYFNGPDSSTPSATFDDEPVVRDAVASATQTSHTVPVELWRGRVWQAEFGGRWYLAGDRPVYEVGATATFAVASGLLFLMARIVVGRRAKGWYVGRRRRLQEGAGQALLLAGGIWWLETGAWWGAPLVVADAAWVVRSVVTSVPVAGLPNAWKTGPRTR